MLHVNRSMVWGMCLSAVMTAAAQGADLPLYTAGPNAAHTQPPAASPITNTLTAQRVVRVDGAEHFESAATGRPGDVIEYTVQFHNSGTTAVHALEATLPIPVGVVLVSDSIQPSTVRASVDGTTFAPMPLMHRVRRADGTVTDEPVPPAQIRYLRWAPADLSANSTLAVSARVVLAGNPDLAAAN